MAVDVEREAIALLIDRDALRLLCEEGVNPEHFFDPENQAIFAWGVDYYHTHGKSDAAPTAEILRSVFPAGNGLLGYDGVVAGASGGMAATYVAQEIRNKFVKEVMRENIANCISEMSVDPLKATADLQSMAAGILNKTARKTERIEYARDLPEIRLRDEQLRLAGGIKTVPYFLPQLSKHTGGIAPGEIHFLVAQPGTGKAVSLDTKLPTPEGWTTMGEVKVGDSLFDEQGLPCRVLTKSEVFTDKRCFEVKFDTGETVVASEDHLWQVLEKRVKQRIAAPPIGRRRTKRDLRVVTNDWREYWGQSRTMTTVEMYEHPLRLSVPCARPIVGQGDMPVEPYLFGYWLGDGCCSNSSITVGDHDAEDFLGIVSSLSDRAVTKWKGADSAAGQYNISRLKEDILLMRGVDSEYRPSGHTRVIKSIPSTILRASMNVRLEVLRGIMDSDGFLSSGNSVGVDLTNKRLFDDVFELVCSFGWKARKSVKVMIYKGEPKEVYRLSYRPNLQVFRLNRKAKNLVLDSAVGQQSRHTSRSIVSVVEVAPVPCQCVAVDSPSHLYLCSEGFIPTHNTWYACAQALGAIKAGWNTFFASLEMDVTDIRKRIESLEASTISTEEYRRNELTPQERRLVYEAQDRIAAVPGKLIMDDVPFDQLTAEGILSRARMSGCDFVIIDQLQWMRHPEGKAGLRHELTEQIIYDLRDVVRGNSGKIPLLLLHQFNRQTKNAPKGIGTMQDIAHSQTVEQVAHSVFAIGRDSEMEKNHQMDIATLKTRNFSAARWTLKWDLGRRAIIEVENEVPVA